METLKAIQKRRSIRSFKDTALGEEMIQTLLKAAMYAPSANNRQPWQFIVVDDPAILAEIPSIHDYAQMADSAPAGILICGDTQIEPDAGYLAVNCAAATQNLLLAAHDIGLGAVWIGIYPREKRIESFQVLFNLPKSILPIAYVVLGHPDESKATPERFLPERIHRNKW